ncbi:hypothetical protein LCGC14_1934820 [marine sediment metagenome]|uniref:Uncharacterized protein n=1 Tax=marine sediment metagenome TaxID=412755 RepID=A0A0F9FM16_9ZZZZ
MWLKENNYDGLCNFECGCGVDDLVPCTELSSSCEAAHLVDSDPNEFPDGKYVPAREK